MLQINLFPLCIVSDGIYLRASAKKALPFALWIDNLFHAVDAKQLPVIDAGSERA